jgi:hypothetical protein
MVFYILTFTSLDSRREDDSEPNGGKLSPGPRLSATFRNKLKVLRRGIVSPPPQAG